MGQAVCAVDFPTRPVKQHAGCSAGTLAFPAWCRVHIQDRAVPLSWHESGSLWELLYVLLALDSFDIISMCCIGREHYDCVSSRSHRADEGFRGNSRQFGLQSEPSYLLFLL